MFRPTNRNPSAPMNSTVFRIPRPAPAAGGGSAETFTQYMEDHRCANPTTIATVGGIIIFLARDATVVPATETTPRTRNLFAAGAAAAIDALVTGPAPENPTEDSTNIANALVNVPLATDWLANLINAAKKSPLKNTNVDGFFAMLGHTGTSAAPVVHIINSIAPFFPDVVSEQAFRDLLAPGVWTDYRLGRVSTGKIMWENIGVFRDLGITVDGGPIEAAIRASRDAPWDISLAAHIPKKLKAYMYLYLEAAGTPIDKWYQGNKARDEIPAARARGAKEIFRRYLEVKNDTAGLNAINNVATFTTDPTISSFW